MESRAAYGYYGVGNGAAGESAPKTHASGWHIYPFFFDMRDEVLGVRGIQFDAKSYENALHRAKKYAKKNGFEFLGDKKGYENQRDVWK